MKRKVEFNSFRELKHSWKDKEIDKIRKDIRSNPEKYDTAHLKAELRRVEKEWQSFCDDPYTQYYGIAGDFRDDYLGKARKVFAELCSRKVCEYDGDCVTDSRYGPHTYSRRS